MGMYSHHKEIPSDVLDKLLDRRTDAAYVDALLFDADGGWRSELCVTDGDPSVFTSPHLPLTAEQMRALGELDGGKHGADDDLMFFTYLLASGAPGRGAALGTMLDLLTAVGGPLDDINARLAEAYGPLPEPVSLGLRTIATTVPCYGIYSYSTPAEVASVWSKLERVLDVHAAHRARVIAAFGDELVHHYRCAMRGNAELSVMW